VYQLKVEAKVTFVTARNSELFAGTLFDAHVFEFAGLEDFAAILAFDKFGVLVATDNLHTKVLAGLLLAGVLRRRGRL
jgi:hypothetical protein